MTTEPIALVARAGRWRFTFRVHPASKPPTEEEALALALAITEALTAGLAQARYANGAHGAMLTHGPVLSPGAVTEPRGLEEEDWS